MVTRTSTTAGMKMTRRSALLILTLTMATALITALLVIGIASATPSAGLTAVPIASGTLAEPIPMKFKDEHGGFGRATDVSKISVVRYEVAPGGTFGWHQHGGPLWVVVAQGTLTFYGASEGCDGREYHTGSAFMDPGNHTHTAWNEGDETLVLYVTFILPDGAPTRIDVQNPGTCPV